jgi:GAF domain-containing protein
MNPRQSTSPAVPLDGRQFLADGGELGAHMRAMDWTGTPLGPPSSWPHCLKTVVRIVLDSRFAMWMAWGKDLTFFYNDAYARDTLGAKHPWALGKPASEVWAEIWPDISPRIDRVLSDGISTWDEGLLLFLERNGYPEETYHTFSYSPLYDESGKRGGMLCVVTEETDRVIFERRVALLRELGAAMTSIKSEKGVFDAIERCLDSSTPDMPFTLTYLFDNQSDAARLASSTAMDRTHPACAHPGNWPLQKVLETNAPVTVDDLYSRWPELPSGPWNTAPVQAILVPIAQQGQSRAAGVFIAALNPHRPLDESYRGFINLLVGQIAAGLANAHAYSEERRRAESLAELDRAKTTFFSNVSHEFRTPLTLMLGPLQDTLAQTNGPLPPRAAEELSIVHRNGLRLLKLVNTLLDFSRIEAGRVQAVYEPTDLSGFTAELASVFRSAVEKAGMQLKIDCPPLHEPAYVDRGMWEKIVLNLLSNAFKFTLEGEIDVSLRATDGYVELKVHDTGCGIPITRSPGSSNASIASREAAAAPMKAPASDWRWSRNS